MDDQELALEIDRSRNMWEREVAAGGVTIDHEYLRVHGTTFELVEYQLRATADAAVRDLRAG